MLGTNGNCSSSHVPIGLAHADFIGNLNLGAGRLDTYQAVQACRLLH